MRRGTRRDRRLRGHELHGLGVGISRESLQGGARAVQGNGHGPRETEARGDADSVDDGRPKQGVALTPSLALRVGDRGWGGEVALTPSLALRVGDGEETDASWQRRRWEVWLD